jgi:hypothetical protein
VSAVLSIGFVNLPGQFVGPLGNLANGIDLQRPSPHPPDLMLDKEFHP